MKIDKDLEHRMNKRLEKLSLEEATISLHAVVDLHRKRPRALDNIKLLGEMPPEDGEPFGFVR